MKEVLYKYDNTIINFINNPDNYDTFPFDRECMIRLKKIIDASNCKVILIDGTIFGGYSFKTGVMEKFIKGLNEYKIDPFKIILSENSKDIYDRINFELVLYKPSSYAIVADRMYEFMIEFKIDNLVLATPKRPYCKYDQKYEGGLSEAAVFDAIRILDPMYDYFDDATLFLSHMIWSDPNKRCEFCKYSEKEYHTNSQTEEYTILCKGNIEKDKFCNESNYKLDPNKLREAYPDYKCTKCGDKHVLSL